MKLVNKLLIKEIQGVYCGKYSYNLYGYTSWKYCISMILKHFNSMYYNSLYAYWKLISESDWYTSYLHGSQYMYMYVIPEHWDFQCEFKTKMLWHVLDVHNLEQISSFVQWLFTAPSYLKVMKYLTGCAQTWIIHYLIIWSESL